MIIFQFAIDYCSWIELGLMETDFNKMDSSLELYGFQTNCMCLGLMGLVVNSILLICEDNSRCEL